MRPVETVFRQESPALGRSVSRCGRLFLAIGPGRHVESDAPSTGRRP